MIADRNRFACICGLLVGALAPACNIVPEMPASLATATVDPEFESYKLRRVGLVPFEGDALDAASRLQIQEAFYTEISQSTPFEVVLLDRLDLAEIPSSQPYRRGWYDPRTIITLSRRFKLDGILVGTVTQHRSYPPQMLSVGLELVSAETGTVLWSAGVHLDAADGEVRRNLNAFVRRRGAAPGSQENLELSLISPSRFARFAAHQVSQLL